MSRWATDTNESSDSVPDIQGAFLSAVSLLCSQTYFTATAKAGAKDHPGEEKKRVSKEYYRRVSVASNR